MGIDTVELVMEVEESFGIKIPDDEAQRIETVGDLFNFVKSQVQLAPAGTCLTAATFYDIRNGLCILGIEKRFGPSTLLADVLPNQNRRSFWSTLARNSKLRLPQLVRPTWIVWTNIALTLATSLVIAFAASRGDPSGLSFPLALIVCVVVLGFLTSSITTPFATNFSQGFRTFRGLSESVLALNAAKLKKEHGPLAANDIWILLRQLIVEQIGVDVDEVTPNAHFVRDLGCS